MNSFERVVATMLGHKVDRPPVLPVLLMQPARELNISLTEYQESGSLIAKGQLKLLERLGHDGVFGFPHVVEDVTAWGVDLVTFEHGSPSVGSMRIKRFEDIDDLIAPDPSSSKMLKETLKAISLLKREVEGEYPVIGAAIAPFSLPSMLMGTEKFMSLLLDDERVRRTYFSKLMKEMITYSVTWCNMQAEAGADAIVLADGMASNTVITRDLFEKLALPIIKETIKQIKVPVIYESVGSALNFLDLLKDVGAAGLILDHSDPLTEAREKLGDSQMMIMGNLNNISSLKWSTLKTQIEVRKSLHEMEGHPYIVSFQGPEVPYYMPIETIEEMISTVKTYGKYLSITK